MTMTTRVQPDTGSTIKPGPMLEARPELVVTDADLADVATGTGLNGPFLADLLAAAATHENDGKNLFQALGHMTANPMLQAKYKQFREESVVAVETYEQLATRLGAPIKYICPAARMTEAMDAKLLEAFQLSGSADPLVLELKGVEAVLMAATLCVANVSLFQHIAAGLPDGEVKAAFDELLPSLADAGERHLEWAATTQRTMVTSQASSKLVQSALGVAENVVGKIKDVFRKR
jgi:hypothetical protein